jgi:8-oxo-dGTP pyrophosphatase MutT (NUDIX family)
MTGAWAAERLPGVFSLRQLGRAVFWILSKLFYSVPDSFRAAIGLRSAAAIIRRGDFVLAIERSDGRGLSLPGGIRYPWESALHCVRRELREESGLNLTEIKTSAPYYSQTLFVASAEGTLAESWEGAPRWAHIEELREWADPEDKEFFGSLMMC